MFWPRRRRRLAELVRTSVVVHLTSDDSIAGILLDEYDDCISVVRARALIAQPGGRVIARALDGEQVIPWPKVKWMQVGVTLDDTLGGQLELVQREEATGR